MATVVYDKVGSGRESLMAQRQAGRGSIALGQWRGAGWLDGSLDGRRSSVRVPLLESDFFFSSAPNFQKFASKFYWPVLLGVCRRAWLSSRSQTRFEVCALLFSRERCLSPPVIDFLLGVLAVLVAALGSTTGRIRLARLAQPNSIQHSLNPKIASRPCLDFFPDCLPIYILTVFVWSSTTFPRAPETERCRPSLTLHHPTATVNPAAHHKEADLLSRARRRSTFTRLPTQQTTTPTMTDMLEGTIRATCLRVI